VKKLVRGRERWGEVGDGDGRGRRGRREREREEREKERVGKLPGYQVEVFKRAVADETERPLSDSNMKLKYPFVQL